MARVKFEFEARESSRRMRMVTLDGDLFPSDWHIPPEAVAHLQEWFADPLVEEGLMPGSVYKMSLEKPLSTFAGFLQDLGAIAGEHSPPKPSEVEGVRYTHVEDL